MRSVGLLAATTCAAVLVGAWVQSALRPAEAQAIRAGRRAPVAPPQGGSSGQAARALQPTAHPPLPTDPAQMWLVPETRPAVTTAAMVTSLSAAADHLRLGHTAQAVAALNAPALRQGPLSDWSLYLRATARLNAEQFTEARADFAALQQRSPSGYLAEAALLGDARAAEGSGDAEDAGRLYARVLQRRSALPTQALLGVARAAQASGDVAAAVAALERVIDEFPLSADADEAVRARDALRGGLALTADSPRVPRELARAEQLFAARRHREARAVLQPLRPLVTGDDVERVALRLAECDVFLKRWADARAALTPLAATAARRAEAQYFLAQALGGVKDIDGFVSGLERVASEFADQTWAEDALDALATHWTRTDDDARAEATFRTLYERYPRGAHAERAAWKAGWAAYRHRAWPDTTRIFEQAAADFPRADYRPAWLYWAARAREAQTDLATAETLYRLTIADYGQSYYGRLATTRLRASGASATPRAETATSAAPAQAQMQVPSGAPSVGMPPNAGTIQALLEARLYDEAVQELQWAQRQGPASAVVEATLAWTRQQQARSETGMRRLELLRAGINGMRRAYPQYLTATGDQLPRELQTVIYPLAYWPLLRQAATAQGLDPFLVAALTAQESTFVADVRSGANAYGLMQLIPSTARVYARKLRLRYSTRLLTTPEANIRMGTAYLADKIAEFGGVPYVLASYNAGERPVRRWQAERPGLDLDEFIDDIPYPETQTYVKKILGTADDYRRLYGSGNAPVRSIEPVTTRTAGARSTSTPSRKSTR